MKKNILKGFICLIAMTMLLCTGCMGVGQPSAKDPLFYYNRTMFYVNRDIDHILIGPITKVYVAITPHWLQERVHNVFSNLDDMNVMVNDLLQLAITDFWKDIGRFLLNTTLGIGGLFDVAAHYHLHKHHNDFGITLARWGYCHPTFFMMPILGPSTTRDFLGFFLDYKALSIWPYLHPARTRNALLAGYAINKRRHLLSKDPLIDQAFDPYVFVRNAYLRIREHTIKKRLQRIKNGCQKKS